MIKTYRDYLISIGIRAGYHNRSYKRMEKQAEAYERWLEGKGLDMETAAYGDLMDYVGYQQSTGKSAYTINRTLQAIMHYYDYKGLPNLAGTTRLRGIIKTQPQGLLTAEELDKIYETFEPSRKPDLHYHTDKLLLGMMIYQGVEKGEFMKIETADVQLEQGRIYIPSGHYKRSRQVPLKAGQVLSLDRYLREIRPTLLTEDSLSAGKLFAPQAEDYHLLDWQFRQLSKKVKQQAREKLGLAIHKLSQLRQSRISVWVQEEGLRKAQYLAGFRRVCSAERYQKAGLEDLKQALTEYHPLK